MYYLSHEQLSHHLPSPAIDNTNKCSYFLYYLSHTAEDDYPLTAITGNYTGKLLVIKNTMKWGSTNHQGDSEMWAYNI